MVGFNLLTNQLSDKSIDVGEMAGWFDMEFHNTNYTKVGQVKT